MIVICALALSVQIGGVFLAHCLFERLISGEQRSALEWIIPASLTLPIFAWFIGQPSINAAELFVTIGLYPWPILAPCLTRFLIRHIR